MALFLFSNMSVGIYIDSLEVFWQTIPDPFFTHAAINRACDKLHVYPECCEKFFLMYESYVSSGYLEKPIPRSLVHLCCCSIRECMGSVFQLPHGIDRLILPENLESYLRLNIPQEPKLVKNTNIKNDLSSKLFTIDNLEKPAMKFEYRFPILQRSIN
ncbi:UNVERIFIED_CONTAM: hypothetical protein NCL1_23186 [Trichonephila clavipes]